MTQSSREAHLQELIRHELPLARFMAVRVESLDESGAILETPAAPNINAHGTMFGGSIGALALLAGWGLVRLRLEEDGEQAEVVVQRTRIEYHTPVVGDACAYAHAPAAEEWARFLTLLRRRGKARVRVEIDVRGAGGSVPGTMVEAWFVALSE